MINAKIAEYVRCTLENTVGKAIWSKDLVDRVIAKAVADKHLKISEADIEAISKLVIQNQCGDDFQEADDDDDDDYIEIDDRKSALYDASDSLVEFDGYYEVGEYLDGFKSDLNKVFEAAKSFPSDTILSKELISLKVETDKLAEVFNAFVKVYDSVNESVDTIKEHIEEEYYQDGY